jgi:hypothetical protein
LIKGFNCWQAASCSIDHSLLVAKVNKSLSSWEVIGRRLSRFGIALFQLLGISTSLCFLTHWGINPWGIDSLFF